MLVRMHGKRCLTPRSSGPPTAWRLGRAAVLFIIVHAAKAPRRCRPLNSNVRQRREAVQGASKVSACRRELNSHEGAEPQAGAPI
jgi:hypothetical protein